MVRRMTVCQLASVSLGEWESDSGTVETRFLDTHFESSDVML